MGLYAARTAVWWQRTGVFLLSGRARLEGGNLLAEGRFAIWGDPSASLLRCDFCGPDGRPVVSAAGDSSGVTIYYPRDESAFYSPGGLPVAGACVPVRSVLFMLRTGMPLELEQWMIPPGAASGEGGATWSFSAGEDRGVALTVTLSPGNVFPSALEWTGGLLAIRGGTGADEFEVWPALWEFAGDSGSVSAEVASVTDPADPWPGLWDLNVPVRVDTLPRLPLLVPAWQVDRE